MKREKERGTDVEEVAGLGDHDVVVVAIAEADDVGRHRVRRTGA